MTCTKLEKLEMIIKYARSIGLDAVEIWWNPDETDSPMEHWSSIHSDIFSEGISTVDFGIACSNKKAECLYVASRIIAESDDKDYETEAFDTKEEAEAWIKEGKEQQ